MKITIEVDLKTAREAILNHYETELIPALSSGEREILSDIEKANEKELSGFLNDEEDDEKCPPDKVAFYYFLRKENCPFCKKPIQKGDYVDLNWGNGFAHVACILQKAEIIY